MTELNLDDRLDFLAIDDARRRALAAAKPSVMAALPDALADLYALIDRTPAVAGVVTSDGRKDGARKAQGGHWERVMSGAFDGDYAASIQRIAGQVEAISSTIESINEAALAIEAAVEEQTVSVDEIARNAEEAASGNQSAAEAAATLERQARETGEAASSVSEVSTSIRAHADALRQAVEDAAAAIRAA